MQGDDSFGIQGPVIADRRDLAFENAEARTVVAGRVAEALPAVDGDRARRALALCQEQFHRFAHHFSFELASYERMDDLRMVGEERGQEGGRLQGRHLALTGLGVEREPQVPAVAAAARVT